jgi:hypothetical protein
METKTSAAPVHRSHEPVVSKYDEILFILENKFEKQFNKLEALQPTSKDDVNEAVYGASVIKCSKIKKDYMSMKKYIAEYRKLNIPSSFFYMEVDRILDANDLSHLRHKVTEREPVEPTIHRLEYLKAQHSVAELEEELGKITTTTASEDTEKEEVVNKLNKAKAKLTNALLVTKIMKKKDEEKERKEETKLTIPRGDVGKLIANYTGKIHFTPSDAEWQPDEEASHCTRCDIPFSLLKRRHHCRECGDIFCSECSKTQKKDSLGKTARVCVDCVKRKGGKRKTKRRKQRKKTKRRRPKKSRKRRTRPKKRRTRKRRKHR